MLCNELVNDIECMSFCDNSVYVLPPKTELNSSFYIEDSDLLNIYGKDSEKYFAQRKISSNVDIPTYKGFSVANGYSTNIKKSAHVLPNRTKNSEKCNIPRKVHISSGDSNVHNEFILIKNRMRIKHKSKTNDQKTVIKVDKNHEKPVKRIETFLGDVNPNRHNNIITTKNVSTRDSKIANRRPPEHNEKIKNYMDNKRSHSKRLMDENRLLEKQKKQKIEERLKLLSKQIRAHENKRKPTQKSAPHRTENTVRQRAEEILEFDNIRKRSATESDTSESETISERTNESIKRKLSQWTPIDERALERYRLDSQDYMRNAVNANRQTDNILANIMAISDKMRMAKQQMANSYHANHKNRYEHAKDTSETSSFSSTTPNDLEAENGYDTPEPIIRNRKNVFDRTRQNDIRKEVVASIVANRARRKLNIDYDDEDVPNTSESESIVSGYDNCIARLAEENQRRYEQSIERNQVIMLPLHKLPPRSRNEEKKINLNKPDIVQNFQKDSLTFMKTYRRCRSGKHAEFSRRIETDTNNSRVSNVSTIVVSSSHRDNHQSMRLSNNVSFEKGGNTLSRQDSIEDSQYSIKSEIPKSATADMSNTLESLRGSHAYSEMEVTIENSTLIEHISIKPAKPYMKPPKQIQYGSTEPRMSPDSLERQLMIELHYHDGLQASMEQLLQADRFQGVGFAQQETVSLAQILKARQWKDSRNNETNENLDRFTAALNNFNKHGSAKHHRPASSSSATSSSIITSDHSRHLNNRKDISITESEASEIEEEIVEFPDATESQPHSNPLNNHPGDRVVASKLNKKDIKLKIHSKPKPPIVPKYDDSEKFTDSVVEIDISQSNVDESAQEISTAISVSKTSSSQKSSKDTSIVESIESQSLATKSSANIHTTKPEIRHNKDDTSITKSVKTDSNFQSSEKSAREISTTRSYENEKKSPIDSTVSSREANSKSETKSTFSTSPTASTAGKSELNITNYSRDEFETIQDSDYQKSTSESDIINRVDVLEVEKKNKQKLVEKLKHKLSIVKHRRKEKSLRNYINHLDSQIEVLKDELDNPNVNSSSISLSPIAKPKKTKSSKEMKILPTYNRKKSYSSSSSSTISKDDDVKSTSVTTSISSATLISDVIKDGQTDNKKPEDVETPRSVKQIQFEDINEEYSASNPDSLELKTPSEKSRLSKEVTDNGATKSKSENFHILIIGKPEIEDDDNEDMKMISARTIHSEISEIPMEGEFSDQEIDDFSEKVDESEKNKNPSRQDLYSEDFSEVTSHRNSKSVNINQLEMKEDSNRETNLSLEMSKLSSSSSSSTEGLTPEIPPRRKFVAPLIDEDPSSVYANSVDVMGKIDDICDSLFRNIFDDIVVEDIRRRKVPRLIGLENIGEDQFVRNVAATVYDPSVDEGDLLDASIDSLNDQLTDDKFESLGTLVPWVDSFILPLVDSAIEQLFNARQHRTGKTADAFAHCRDNMPSQFSQINSLSEITRIHTQWSVLRARDKNTIDVHKLYISRLAIYSAVWEIMHNIYELDDAPASTPWMTYEFDSARKKKLTLWQGNDAPNSLDIVTRIVRKQLAIIDVVSPGGDQQQTSILINRSRQHQWFINKTDDPVDRLLIDETFQDDTSWQNYNRAIERTIYMITDEIVANEIDEIVIGVEMINGGVV